MDPSGQAEEKRKQKEDQEKPKLRGRSGSKREKGDSSSKYSEVLKATSSDVKLVDLGTDVTYAVFDALVQVKSSLSSSAMKPARAPEAKATLKV